MLSLKNRISKNRDVPWRIIEEEAILVDVKKGEVIHLNETGAKIWDLIDGKRSIGDIAKGICDIFEIDKETAQKDTSRFISEAVKKRLAVVSDE